MKTGWPILLGLLLLAAAAAAQAQYAYSTNADGSIYTYNTNTDGSINIAGYSGPPWAVTIPTDINNLPVTSIGNTAFQGSAVTSVTIPGSVTNIGDYAFYYCVSLTNATIANGVTGIGAYAFYNCYGLTNLTIPGSVTGIGDDAFFGCYGLTSVTIANGVTSIGTSAFTHCFFLTSITIPGSVTSIGEYAFQHCDSLSVVFFQGNAPTADSTVFYPSESKPTGYYLPGTTGWSEFSANTGLPAVLWNPLIRAGGANFGAHAGQFGFDITGTNNFTVIVEACANLGNPVWVPLRILTLTNGSFHFSDPQWTNYSSRYYSLQMP